MTRNTPRRSTVHNITDGEALKILRIASYSGCYRLGYKVMLSLRDIDGN